MTTHLTIRIDERPFDLEATMTLQALGRFDPTVRRGPGVFEKVHTGPDGHVRAWRFRAGSDGLSVELRSEADVDWGGFVDQFPLADGLAELRPEQPVLRRLVLAFPGLRLLRVPWTFDVAVGAILQQRVTFEEAASQFRRIVERWGTPFTIPTKPWGSAGPRPLGIALPNARTLASVPLHELQAIGIDVRRARALRAIAREEVFRSFLDLRTDLGELDRRLSVIPGIGPWTRAMIAGFAAGDPDAVPVGDLHLPSLVTAALAGEPRGDDARMLALLEPYRGFRFRVVRLLWAGLTRTRRGVRLRV